MTLPGGFPAAEFAQRTARAQALMARESLAALLLTNEPDLRYFSGFLTRFWESPTRPWFLIVPASGDPVAVIPSIGRELMARTWLRDIRTWRAPDPVDDGVGLLADTLRELAGPGGRIGVPMGPGTHLRMPLQSWRALRLQAAGLRFDDDAGIVRDLRMVKSEPEIGRIRTPGMFDLRWKKPDPLVPRRWRLEVAGRIAAPFLGAYAASKHALEAVSDSLRRELMLYGVDVIVIEPGSVATPIWDKAESADYTPYFRTDYKDSVSRLRAHALKEGRAGFPPERVAASVLRALVAPKPPTRIPVVPGRLKNWLLPRLLPDRALDALIAKGLGLRRPER